MENFVFEEKEERSQKKMENDDIGIDVECEQCGQMVSFGVFLQHMKGHNALQNMHYEIYQEFNDIYENEELTNNNSFITRKHLFEDIEEEGLIETIGSYVFRANAFQLNIACQIHKALLGLKY
ncbi:MAG: hypothetical protein EZS28_033674 [Streblomastix strix]|uniref:Uncharacterized protein n=1 Tax=Streblomastix strix TaxID=222440 RepID=A0A5J4UJS9_9EUKA|nr:MAG: hypothetical protein EZS28_033674 [Streblomastix strix]